MPSKAKWITIFASLALLMFIVLATVNPGGPADRNVPGRTTGEDKSSLVQ